MDWLQPPAREPPEVRRYGVALVAVATAAIIATGLMPLWGNRFPFLSFFPAVLVAAWYGRFPAGVAATGLSIAALLWLLPAGSFAIRDVGDAAGVFAFATISLLIAALCEGLHRLAGQRAASAERLDGLLRDAPVGLCFLDRDLRFVYINDELVRINGVPRERHLGRSVADVLAPRVAETVGEYMREVLRTGEPIVSRIVAEGDEPRTPNDPRVALASYSPIRGADGTIDYVGVAVTDITEQQRLSDAIAHSEARLQAIADASIRITSMVSIDRPLEDALGSIADLVRDVVGARQARIVTDLDEPPPSSATGQLVVPIIGRDGKRLGLLRLADKSERAFGAEDTAVTVQFAQMASAAIETHQLFHQILEADRRKDEFLAMLGHELRNPLAAIHNAVVTAAQDDRRRLRAIDIARRQSEQLARLVDDLLDVARITQGRITLQQQVVSMAAVVERAVDAVQPQIDARRHVLTLPRVDRTVNVRADAARLQQVVLNLLSNAAKYTDPGGRIDVVVERSDDQAVIRVRDTGKGIAPDMLARVFDLFAQAERTLDRAQGGLGIGLTVARRLVELQGGRIEAHSAGLGHGSEFVVRLPVLTRPSSRAGTESPGRPAASRGRTRVLIVEDNVDAAESLSMLLEVLGHDARVVYDGEAALAAARESFFQVMLIDIGLPRMDGYELARRLRARLEASRVILVALTGYGRSEDRERALAAGFDHHLVKPVDPTALQGLLAARHEMLLGRDADANCVRSLERTRGGV